MFFTIIFDSASAFQPILRKIIRVVGKGMIKNPQSMEEIELVIHEAVSNIIIHAYKNESGHSIKLAIDINEAGINETDIAIQIFDNGIKNKTTHSDKEFTPDKEQTDEQETETPSENGRGVFIIYSLMDEVSYQHTENENILSLRKKLIRIA